MNGQSPLLRQWQLLAALASRSAGGTVGEFAREQQVDEKTIRRDLVVLRRAGFPLEESLGDHGRKHWTLAPLASLPMLSLNWMEAISLYLCRQFMSPLAETHFGISASRAFKKIRATFGDNSLRYLEKMSRAFHVTGAKLADYASKAALIDELTQAIEEYRIVQLTYQSERSTEPVSRDVHPLAWIFHNAAAYLAAYAPDRGDRRLYKLDRMVSAFATDLRFPKPATFSAEEFLAGALGVYRGGDGPAMTVRVRFDSSVARFVKERRWHSSQQLTPEPDGSLLAEFQLTSLVEIKSWLLSWGRNVEVLEPAELIETLRTEITALAALYAPLPGSPPLTKGGQGGSPRGSLPSPTPAILSETAPSSPVGRPSQAVPSPSLPSSPHGRRGGSEGAAPALDQTAAPSPLASPKTPHSRSAATHLSDGTKRKKKPTAGRKPK